MTTKQSSIIVDKILKKNISTTVICTNLTKVNSNSENDLSLLFPCNHEEANTRIFVNLNHAVQNGDESTLIRTVELRLLL